MVNRIAVEQAELGVTCPACGAAFHIWFEPGQGVECPTILPRCPRCGHVWGLTIIVAATEVFAPDVGEPEA